MPIVYGDRQRRVVGSSAAAQVRIQRVVSQQMRRYGYSGGIAGTGLSGRRRLIAGAVLKAVVKEWLLLLWLLWLLLMMMMVLVMVVVMVVVAPDVTRNSVFVRMMAS